MSKPKKKPFKIFYSWQSDLPNQVNAQLIRSVLGEVASELNEDDDIEVKAMCDEATRDTPGSPKIVDTIFEKILQSDAFVCDLSKVHETIAPDGEARKFCNANVAIELGFAIRELGWNRIILVFNEAYGKLPHDLPFDTHGNRATKYRCVAAFIGKKLSTKTASDITNAKGHLKKQLVSALKLIVTSNPKRPSELESKSPEDIQRERDVEQLQRVFNFIHLKMLDRFIDRLGYSRITEIGLSFCEGLERIMCSNTFHIYDPKLLKLVREFFLKWQDCFRYLSEMDANPSHTEFYFHMPMDIAKSQEQAEHCRDTGRSATPLRVALDALLKYVRVNYLEIDPNTCGYEAMKHYSATSKK
jgi:hypothetical protein